MCQSRWTRFTFTSSFAAETIEAAAAAVSAFAAFAVLPICASQSVISVFGGERRKGRR